jgi:hypothetical protein
MRATVAQPASARQHATIVDRRNRRFRPPAARTMSVIRPTWSSYGLIGRIRRQESQGVSWAIAISTYKRPSLQKRHDAGLIASVYPTGDRAVDGRARLPGPDDAAELPSKRGARVTGARSGPRWPLAWQICTSGKLPRRLGRSGQYCTDRSRSSAHICRRRSRVPLKPGLASASPAAWSELLSSARLSLGKSCARDGARPRWNLPTTRPTRR